MSFPRVQYIFKFSTLQGHELIVNILYRNFYVAFVYETLVLLASYIRINH